MSESDDVRPISYYLWWFLKMEFLKPSIWGFSFASLVIMIIIFGWKFELQSFELAVVSTFEPVEIGYGEKPPQVTIKLTRKGGFTGDVAVSFQNLPSGVSAKMAPPIESFTFSGINEFLFFELVADTANAINGSLVTVSGVSGTLKSLTTFRTTIIPPYSLTVQPDPVDISRGKSMPVRIGVTPKKLFDWPVTVDLSQGLHNGVDANPMKSEIRYNQNTRNYDKGTFSLEAKIDAKSRQATVYANSNGHRLDKEFQINILTPENPQIPPLPVIQAVVPEKQQKGGMITISGSNFDTNCEKNTVKFGNTATATLKNCKTDSLMVEVPQQATYGKTNVKVTVGNNTSNLKEFTTARQAGAFVEITNDILGQLSSRACSLNTAEVKICSPNCLGAPIGKYVATFKKTNGTQIGQSIQFLKGNQRVGGALGGIGFSLCNAGILLDGESEDTGQLMAFKIVNLETGSQSSHPFNFLTPDGKASYNPRVFRSQDGTIILFVTPANTGPAQLTAGFIDNTASPPQTIGQIPISPISQIDGAISANVTIENKIIFSFAGTRYADIMIP